MSATGRFGQVAGALVCALALGGCAAFEPEAPNLSDYANGISELWRVPGAFWDATEHGGVVLTYDPESRTATAHQVRREQVPPLWTGTCTSAAIVGRFIACDDELTSLDTGEVTALPAGSLAVVAHDAPGDFFAVLTTGLEIVGYDADLTELWRLSGGVPAFETLTEGRLLTLVPPGADPGTSNLTSIDIQTGAVLASGRDTAWGMVDGYVVYSDSTLILTAYDWNGAIQWNRDVNHGLVLATPAFGEPMTLAHWNPELPADVLERVTLGSEGSGVIDLGEGLAEFHLGDQDARNDTFWIGGSRFFGAPLQVRGSPTGDVIIAWLADETGTGMVAGTAFYQFGQADPVWSVESNLVRRVFAGGLLVGSTGSGPPGMDGASGGLAVPAGPVQEMIIYAPAPPARS